MTFRDAVNIDGCLYITGDPATPEHSCCGLPRQDAVRYCPAHQKLCVVATAPINIKGLSKL